jgi:hypothetical protein
MTWPCASAQSWAIQVETDHANLAPRSRQVTFVRHAVLVLALTPLLPLAARAQPAQPTVVNVELSDYRFEPKVIELKRGQAYILHLTNPSNSRHGLEAKEFFDTVDIADWSKRRVVHGDIEVWPRQWNDVGFTPTTAGEYPMHSPDWMNVMFGMTGEIVVR